MIADQVAPLQLGAEGWHIAVECFEDRHCVIGSFEGI